MDKARINLKKEDYIYVYMYTNDTNDQEALDSNTELILPLKAT